MVFSCKDEVQRFNLRVMKCHKSYCDHILIKLVSAKDLAAGFELACIFLSRDVDKRNMYSRNFVFKAAWSSKANVMVYR